MQYFLHLYNRIIYYISIFKEIFEPDKTMNYRKFSCIVICTLTITIVKLQFSQLKSRHLDASNGLSRNTVRFIIQDKYGFMWFGTFNGVNRYDGYEFETYKSENNNDKSISLNRCANAYLDSTGIL